MIKPFPMQYVTLGVHKGVIAKLKRYLGAEWLESSPCVAHTFSLAGSEAAYLQESTRRYFLHSSFKA